jgi:hypothetical protein
MKHLTFFNCKKIKVRSYDLFLKQTERKNHNKKDKQEDRIPVEAIYFAHVQTGPGAHSASCTIGTESFLGVKRPGRDADHPPPSSAEVMNE